MQFNNPLRKIKNMTTLHLKESIGRSPLRLAFLLIPLALACFALSPGAQAVSPPPDGGYPGGNTAEGNNALLSLTTGEFNTAVGLFSLALNTIGDSNTGVGFSALRNNTDGDENTAVGAGALFLNTTGDGNTALGVSALDSNTTGFGNTAVGDSALDDCTEGNENVAVGDLALNSCTDGDANVAVGFLAGGSITTGSRNVLLGAGAGVNVKTASNVIAIGAEIVGINESNTCFIGNIFGQGTPAGVSVLISANGRLGTVISSKRFKEDIQPMDKASEALFSLKPVSFRYKKEIDPAGTPQLGLVAEDVEKVNAGLIVRDKEGKPYSVRYEQVNAMLLNEFLKEHREVAELKSTVAEQRKGMEAVTARLNEQAAQIQKVSAQLEASKAAPQTVANNQ